MIILLIEYLVSNLYMIYVSLTYKWYIRLDTIWLNTSHS